VSGGCKCYPISVKRNPKINANVVVSECTVCRVIGYKIYVIIIFYIYFLVVNTQNDPPSCGLVAFTVVRRYPQGGVGWGGGTVPVHVLIVCIDFIDV